jgi:hypothetical protein
MVTRPRVTRFAMAIAGLLLIAGARSTAEAQETALSRDELLRRFARAYYPGRTGQLAVVPRAGHIITKRGAATVFMHGSPWWYDSRIPFLLYGPRFVRGGVYTEPVSHQDMAPTLAELLGVPMPSTCSGRSQSAVLKPGVAPPRLVLLLVLDGMRQDYFDRHAAPAAVGRQLLEYVGKFANGGGDRYSTSVASPKACAVSES